MNMSTSNSIEGVSIQVGKQYSLKRQSTIACKRGNLYDTISSADTSTCPVTVTEIPIWTTNPRISQPIASMHIDMTLATSYKPILVCIAKVSILMIFHYTSVPMLFVTERYALIVAVLYIDKWIASEYILNTNSCTAMLAFSLLVHELRDLGIQERIHGEIAHNIALSVLVLSNILVIILGEQNTIFHMLLPPAQMGNIPTATTYSETSDDVNNKRYRQQLHSKTNVNFSFGTFACVLNTSILLVVLSTCAMPVSAHDPVLNNIRVWSFTILSLTWIYTVNYKNLRYSTISPFTPCLLRFSCILFLTPTPIALTGIVLVALCLSVTHVWLNQNKNPPGDTVYTDHVHLNNSTDSVAVVVKDMKSHSSMGSVISYRAPCSVQEKTDTPSVIAKSVSPRPTQNATRDTVDNATVSFEKQEDHVKEAISTIADPSLDYASMFLQAMSERADEDSTERSA